MVIPRCKTDEFGELFLPAAVRVWTSVKRSILWYNAPSRALSITVYVNAYIS